MYDPYPNFVRGSDRNLIQTRLIEKDGNYEFDWDDFKKKLRMSSLFLFVSPHNPGGVVWNHETLSKVQRYCQEEGVIIVSDEVHCDLTLTGKLHTPFFSVDEVANSQSIVLISIGKAFNAPGVQGGW